MRMTEKTDCFGKGSLDVYDRVSKLFQDEEFLLSI